nr:hypothetical protein [Tanacetum cinerariifolium]GEZ12347.1 hypothetical protein [Tanacetum cinerariifolium]
MTLSASSSTKNPPRNIARNNVIDISSNKSSTLQENNPIPINLNTTLELSITPPNISHSPPNQPLEASPLALRALVIFTPPTSPIEPHLYLNSLDDFPPRSSNPPLLPLDKANNQTLPHVTLINFEPSFQSTNLRRKSNRLFAQPKPFMSHEQILEDIGQLQDFSQNIEIALRNTQGVQNSLLPPITSSQMPHLPSSLHLTAISTTAILLFRPVFPPS